MISPSRPFVLEHRSSEGVVLDLAALPDLDTACDWARWSFRSRVGSRVQVVEASGLTVEQFARLITACIGGDS